MLYSVVLMLTAVSNITKRDLSNESYKTKSNLGSTPGVIDDFTFVCGNGVLFKQPSQRWSRLQNETTLFLAMKEKS